MFTDKEGVNHEVSVQADSVFEAAAFALCGFRDDERSAESSHWTGALEIVVKQPEVTRKISLEKFHSFLESKGGSPRDITRREKLNRILDGK